MITAKDLKTATEAFLKQPGYPINPHLPQIEELAELRIASSLTVRRRCLILASVCARAHSASGKPIACIEFIGQCVMRHCMAESPRMEERLLAFGAVLRADAGRDW
jgi:hypothetical protein